MDGLTNIIAKIHEENDAECENILTSAREEAESILAKAKSEARVVASRIEEMTDNEVEISKARAVSNAEIEYKRAVLSKKSELLDGAILKAVETIKNSSDDVYFGYIKKLLLSNALEGSGTVRMSDKDISKLPKGFEEEINVLLSSGRKIKISKEPLDVDGGFIIEYTEMSVDCTFSSLVNDKSDEIRDELSKVLFA